MIILVDHHLHVPGLSLSEAQTRRDAPCATQQAVHCQSCCQRCRPFFQIDSFDSLGGCQVAFVDWTAVKVVFGLKLYEYLV